MTNWWSINATEVVGVLLSLILLYGAVILFSRLFGLRSFSKMSAADFAMTIAVGSILGAGIANPNPSVPVAGFALLGLFAAQLPIAFARRRFAGVRRVLDNQPVLLVKAGQILPENLQRTGVSIGDVRAKLREANALRLDEVAAVVFETTGDVSVLHGAPFSEVDPFLLEDVADGSGSPPRGKV